LTSTDPFTIRHLRVARIKPKEPFVLIHQGLRMECRLIALKHDNLRARVLYSEKPPRPRPRLLVALGLLEGRKLDEAVFVLTQLGVDSFIIFQSKRSRALRITASREERWRRKILDACEISDIVHPPALQVVAGIDALSELGNRILGVRAHQLLFYEAADDEVRTLMDVVSEPYGGQGIIAVVGPEGGFESEEVAAFARRRFQVVSLSARILEARAAAYYIASHLTAWMGKLA